MAGNVVSEALERAKAHAHEHQKEVIDDGRDLVGRLDRLEDERRHLSILMDQHQQLAYGESGAKEEWGMTDDQLRETADRLQEILGQMEALRQELPDTGYLTSAVAKDEALLAGDPYARMLAQQPDLVAAGIVEPLGSKVDANQLTGNALKDYMRERYGFELGMKEAFRPITLSLSGSEDRPSALEESITQAEPPEPFPDRTPEELLANERAARGVVDAQSYPFVSARPMPGLPLKDPIQELLWRIEELEDVIRVWSEVTSCAICDRCMRPATEHSDLCLACAEELAKQAEETGVTEYGEGIVARLRKVDERMKLATRMLEAQRRGFPLACVCCGSGLNHGESCKCREGEADGA